MAGRGRPRSFDREKALGLAMRVFWAKGYDGTQIQDLTKALNINPPSFYAAFTSKEVLFRESVERYRHEVASRALTALDEHSVYDAVKLMLVRSVEVAITAPGAKGCLLIVGAVSQLGESEAAVATLRELRNQTIRLIGERLRKGVSDGELVSNVDPEKLAHFFAATIQGISLHAQDGASLTDLLGIVDVAVSSLLPYLSEPRPPRQRRLKEIAGNARS